MKLCCPFQVSLFIKLIMKIKREKIFIHIFSAPPTNIRHKMYASALNVFKFVFINLFFIFEVPYLQYLIFCIIFHHPSVGSVFPVDVFILKTSFPDVLSCHCSCAEQSTAVWNVLAWFWVSNLVFRCKWAWQGVVSPLCDILFTHVPQRPPPLPLSRCVGSTTRIMVLSTSQQVALAFTAVLFTFVVLPRLFGVGGGTGVKESRFDSRYSRKGRTFTAVAEGNMSHSWG